MPCLLPLLIKLQFGIYRDQRSSGAVTGRGFAVAGNWWLQLTLTAMAVQTIRFIRPPLVKRRSGISITMFTSAPRSVPIFQPVGAWSGSELTSLASWFTRYLSMLGK